ncbi:MAG: HAMP domain-containing histidine kinase [Deltaproteobacteria bacterium]|nr:HAMP domain-containing histidine kinase [Deltaproteobacteria bacterium]
MFRLSTKTLRFKISLSLIAFIFFTCWILSFIFVVNDLNRISEDIQREGEFFAETISSVIPNLLVNRNYQVIDDILENVKKKPLFNYILVTDPEGGIIAQTDLPVKGEYQGLRKVSKIILYKGDVIGKVEIGLRVEIFFQRMGKALLEAFAFSLFFMFMGILLSITISKKITAPVERLSQRATAFTGTGLPDEGLEESIQGDEVEVMERSFNRMIDGLRKKEEQIKEKNRELLNLAGGISHELNNIINIIIGFSRALQREVEIESEHHRDLETIIREAKKAKAVIENLMSFARLPEMQYTYFDIAGCLDVCIADIESQIRVQGINVRRDYEDGLPLMRGDEKQLRESFFNIILNSVQAMPGGGELTLECKRHNNILEIKISDTGEGIPDDIKESIFEPLFTTKRGVCGVGLGLPISKKIIERHNGAISFSSKRGEGTTFYISIPID